MRFRSTRGRSPETDLAGALTRGLAPDGGLYHPVYLPPFPAGFLTRLRASEPTPADTGAAVLGHLLSGPGGLDRDRVEAAVREALDFPIPLVPLPVGTGSVPSGEATGPIHVLELFHGPTLAFKDVGARVMARLVSLLASGEATGGMTGAGDVRAGETDTPLTILTATSGDTGGAVASAFHGVPGTRVVVLFPLGQVSPRQEAQFSTLGGNTRALGVHGTFDDCQRMVKEAFRDEGLRDQYRLTSANSINVGRLLPQIVYHVHAWLQLPPSDAPVVMSVPSGNFGNLTAGLMAKRMGLPVTRFVAATNRNDVVPRYLQGAPYEPGASHRTVSSAMDVGDPSNFERIVALYRDPSTDVPGAEGPERRAAPEAARGALGRDVVASAWSDDETRRAIRRIHDSARMVVDPHTAVGIVALEEALAHLPGARGIVLATAHPAKFAEVVEPILDRTIPIPPALATRMEAPRLVTPVAPTLEALRRTL
ncbi:MAG: threonine synthase, partial [Gemmatimonadales bacterium]